MMTTSTKAAGRPMPIHCTKSNCTSACSCRNRTVMKFGGLPIRVPMPPTEAAYAIASTLPEFASSSSGRVPRRIGIKIAAVAVLLIHIESTTAVIMKAIRRRIGEPRTSRRCMSDRAMRRSSPCRVMALAMKKPPMKRKISGSAYGAKAARLSVTPTTIIAGAISSAVTEIGTTSVTQATITAAKTAASRWGRGSSPSGANQAARNSAGVRTRPTVRRSKMPIHAPSSTSPHRYVQPARLESCAASRSAPR